MTPLRSLPLTTLFFLVLLAQVAWAGPKDEWKLASCEITYVVTHPLHVVHGKSLSARGKGVSYDGHGEFLVAVPVRSFDSGDQNRDLHMLEVTRAGDHPLIQVKVHLSDFNPSRRPAKFLADLSIQFAGQTVEMPKVRLEAGEWTPQSARVSGGFSLSLKAFGIKAPSLLTMPIEDGVPIHLDMVWKKNAGK